MGLSDHTEGIGVAIASVAYGSVLIEKHFTLDNKDGGLDDSFSINPKQLKDLVVESKRAWKSKGRVYYGISKSEKPSLIFKRSIYISKDIKKNQLITKNNVKIVRPSSGLHPKYFNFILGKRAKRNLFEANPLKLNDLKKWE